MRRSAGFGAAGVQVHAKEIVGDYEVAVLSADDPLALNQWLVSNGFHVSPETGAAIQAYIDEGWFFTAVKLLPVTSDRDRASTHPLAFRFSIDQPVYPLRLTATGSSELDVDLYIFGPKRASADNFEVQYCNRLTFYPDATEDDWLSGSTSGDTTIRHPELRRRVERSSFITKLSAKLTPGQMSHDALIRWDNEETYTPVRWTYAGAKTLAANIGYSCLAILVVCVLFVFPKREWIQQARFKALLFVAGGAAVSVIVAGAVYLALPKAEANIVSLSRIRWRHMEHNLQHAVFSIKDRMDVDRFVDEVQAGAWPANPFTGGTVIIEDSPGNFTYEWIDDGLAITAYGPDGAPLRIDNSEPDQD